jgi:site-specific DNA-methyltransferase (adenine-specific)
MESPKQIESKTEGGLVAPPCSPLLDLRLADCMDVMREAPDNHWDLAIVDPPYGIGWDGQREHRASNRLHHEHKGWDKKPPPPEYFAELRRVSKDQIIWGANYMVENLNASPCWVIWDKMQEFSGAVFEMAWTSFKSPAKAFRMSRVEAYTNQEKIHPTQKPVALYKWLLAKYAKPGMRVLDTHMGSGSIAIACHYAGHHLTACEIDPDYFAAAVERIDRETAQRDFFSENSQESASTPRGDC